MLLEPRTAQVIKDLYAAMLADGSIPPVSQWDGYLQTFHQKFGPDRLRSVDGEALLNLIHDTSAKDNLTYWLEFKNDAEFPQLFGGIGGGSALKFGLYKRRETGRWMTGPGTKQVEISIEEAARIARSQRDQLLAGVALLEALPQGAGKDAYARLQAEMDEKLPHLNDSGWFHKYFSLLFPDKIDPFHTLDFQRFQLTRLLIEPPAEAGRYRPAYLFVQLGQELEIPLFHLGQVLRKNNGDKYGYWRIGTLAGDAGESQWQAMLTGGYISIELEDLGDLSWLEYKQESKDKLRDLIARTCPGKTPKAAGGDAGKVFGFVVAMATGDLVVTADGKNVLGIARVTGDYQYRPDLRFPHIRPVEWLSFENWLLGDNVNLQPAVGQIRAAQVQIQIEQHLRNPVRAEIPTVKMPLVNLTGKPAQIEQILARKGQVILYGPPGTGKTHWAWQSALEIAARAAFQSDYESLTPKQKAEVTGTGQEPGLVRMCTFHPAYGYEDFIEGYRPASLNGQLVFERRDGVFKRLCQEAALQLACKFILIVDEINRGDIPRIFGELLTLLEKDKRGREVLLPLSAQAFSVPPNVFVIGTMNTADRSIALLDTALRRRFGFMELMPEPSLLASVVIAGIPLQPWLEALNERILQSIGRDARNLQIGHAYFLENGRPIVDSGRFMRILQEDILPLLEEYCYEDYDALEKILGSDLVDRNCQRIRHELFQPDRFDDLVRAIVSPAPDITATLPAILQAAQQEELSAEDENGSGAG